MKERIAIFGAGLSGQAARRLALAQGHEVTLFDEAGGGDADCFETAQLAELDRFVFSPGFAACHPWRLLVEGSNQPIQSELSFAAEHWKGRIIGVTGTNGKTTLTRLLAEAFACAGKQAVVAGNIGQPLSDVVLDFDNVETACAVCEISSFQAELVEGMELDALLWTNFAEDHLDRYESMAEYFKAKRGLFECLKPDAVCVLGPQVLDWLEQFGEPRGAAVIADEDSAFCARLKPGTALSRWPYRENFSLAAKFWQLTGEPEEALLTAANEFVLAPYRLDVVTEKDGVSYWNDSKSTNFHAVLAALKAVPRPIIWIGGGRNKGGDLEAFAEALSGQVDAAVLYGEVAPSMEQALAGKVDSTQTVLHFEAAVRLAAKLAGACIPSNVLLSPGFSSFDQFKSYEARGKSFNSIVLGL